MNAIKKVTREETSVSALYLEAVLPKWRKQRVKYTPEISV